MGNNIIKAAQVIACPHCGKEIYTVNKVDICGIVSVTTKEESDKTKIELLQRITEGDLSGSLKNTESAIEWLTNPESILAPQDVGEFIENIT
jgi:hypothetical protein